MDRDFRKTYEKKKVLITGHTGFKGSWLSIWLKELGADVIGYSLDPPTQPNLFDILELKDKITHITGDVRDEKHLADTFEKYQPEYVYHMAAQPLVIASYEEPKLTYETNIIGTINVLEALRKTKSVKACIIITSDKCYENKESTYGYKETDKLGGYDPYSSSKACAELVTAAYRNSYFNPDNYGKKHNVAISTVRSGNVIGGGDWSKNRIIPDCIRSLSENKTIFVRNPQSKRPWQYILDTLSGYLLLGSLMTKDGAKFSSSWNFGPADKNIITVEEMVRQVIIQWKSGTYTKDNSINNHETAILKLDTTKAKKQLNWKPVYDIDETIKATVAWYKNYYTNETNMKKKENVYEFTKKCISDYVNSKTG